MSAIQEAKKFLQKIRGKVLTREERIDHALELTALLLDASLHEKTHKEKVEEHDYAKMMEDPVGRAFVVEMTDTAFRSNSPARTADQLNYLLHKYGVPQFLDETDRIKFLLFRLVGNSFPSFAIPLIKRQIRKEFAPILLPEEDEKRSIFFEERRKEGVRINLNHLGEAILGEKEAERRWNIYLKDLQNPQIEYVSIKISTIFSQLNLIGWEDSLEKLATRLRKLYKTAATHLYEREDGTKVPKFVNLDMEEHKDFDLTIAVFQKVLSEEEFLSFQGGIVLQSYLPESFSALKTLTEWALKKVEKGGTPIKIRLVKGANLSMERTESSLFGWEEAPFSHKEETDANFLRMLEYATDPDHTKGVSIGVGSHNLFSIAYALLLRNERKVESSISFEMLQGMGKAMQRVLRKLTGEILLYCPEAKEKDFPSAVAYLIRRLEENSGKEHFLRHFYTIRPDNKVWKTESNRFTEAFIHIDKLPETSRRKQNRLLPPIPKDDDEPFENETDTDFSQKPNRDWVEAIYQKWENYSPSPIPLVIGGKNERGEEGTGIDPSRPKKPFYRFALADQGQIESALQCAKEHQKAWGELPYSERYTLLGKVANLFRERRGELIGAMIADGGKTVWEADPEVSEAIDFIEYYRKNFEKQQVMSDLGWAPKGTVLVAPPWNFPCSIPVGGVSGALTAGNCVLFKPAPETVLVGWEIAKIFWEAGIPKEVLQFLSCKEDPVGNFLLQHPDLDTVILTGATETAKHFLKLRPSLDLHAETGGKNAMIITAMSDRDLAVRDLVHSAFGHSGQKCSACSLGILEAEVYDSPDFRRQLRDAAKSLVVDSAWNRSAAITPLIRPPSGALLRGLTTLEEGESWLLEPKSHPENPHLYSPGIKLGVKRGSFTHQTELFGPVLGLMRAESLDEAIELANGTRYGLTSGLHSLDAREQERWKEKICAGNLYINRSITGAIVRRQSFGGIKASSFGPGAKAGGPSYVTQLANPILKDLPHERAPLPGTVIPIFSSLSLPEEEKQTLKRSAESYAYWAEILKEPSDPSCVRGEENYFYHVPLDLAILRYQGEESLLPLLQIVTACLVAKTPLQISSSTLVPGVHKMDTVEIVIEGEKAFLSRMEKRPFSKIRLLSPPTPELLKWAAEHAISSQASPPSPHGRLELPLYLRELSLSRTTHRYGFLGG